MHVNNNNLIRWNFKLNSIGWIPFTTTYQVIGKRAQQKKETMTRRECNIILYRSKYLNVYMRQRLSIRVCKCALLACLRAYVLWRRSQILASNPRKCKLINSRKWQRHVSISGTYKSLHIHQRFKIVSRWAPMWTRMTVCASVRCLSINLKFAFQFHRVFSWPLDY